jgi:putative ABC transport system substrate-binding protein
MAARSARAAARADAADRGADGVCRERPGQTGLRGRIPGGTPDARVGREPQHPDRHALGPARRGSDTTCDGARCTTADLILSHNTPTTAALLQQTRTIPVVFAVVSDPVGSGFVASFPRPGGNVTGFTNIEPTAIGKWLELLKEVAPRVARVALLFNPATAPFAEYYLSPFKAAAASLALDAIAARVRDTSELKSAIAVQARAPNGGLVVMTDSFVVAHRAEIISLAARYRLPAVYPFRFFAEHGGLLSYGNDLVDSFRRAAIYADRILKGAKPSELPVQAPVKFELVINLKTAKALGLDIPPTLLARADEVIE